MDLWTALSATRDHARPWFSGFATAAADRALLIVTVVCAAMWCVVGWALVALV
tara:strand:+ start:1814 stop:1972 length:159 start_codon:yes stop_codon:yes gene_type:complete